MQSCDLLIICHSTIWRLQFLLITQHEAPFINKSEATKRSGDQKENGKWTNVTNRRSRVGCQPHFTRIFQQENKANFLVPIDFCNSSRFCCKLFLFFEETMTHVLQIYSDVACMACNFKFASAMFYYINDCLLLALDQKLLAILFNLFKTKYTLEKVHWLANKLATKLLTRPF